MIRTRRSLAVEMKIRRNALGLGVSATGRVAPTPHDESTSSAAQRLAIVLLSYVPRFQVVFPTLSAARGLGDRHGRGPAYVASATRHFSYPSNFSVSHPVRNPPTARSRCAVSRVRSGTDTVPRRDRKFRDRLNLSQPTRTVVWHEWFWDVWTRGSRASSAVGSGPHGVVSCLLGAGQPAGETST